MTPRYFRGALAVSASLVMTAPAWAASQQPTPVKSSSAQAAKPVRQKTSPTHQKAAVKPKRSTMAKPVEPAAPVVHDLPGVTIPTLTLARELNSKPAALPRGMPQAVPVVPAPGAAVGKPAAAAPEKAAGAAQGRPALAMKARPDAVSPDKPAPGAPTGHHYVGALTPPVLAYGPNPYLTRQQVNDPIRDLGLVFDGLKRGMAPEQPKQAPAVQEAPAAKARKEDFFDFFQLPVLPPLSLEDFSLLPKIKTVYPTGEKPLVILTFKCPTELIGITPLPTKALHDIITWGMDGINSTNLLAFNMQQVCQ